MQVIDKVIFYCYSSMIMDIQGKVVDKIFADDSRILAVADLYVYIAGAVVSRCIALSMISPPPPQ